MLLVTVLRPGLKNPKEELSWKFEPSAKCVQKKQELTRKKLELEIQEEKLQIQADLAVSEARCRAIDDFEAMSTHGSQVQVKLNNKWSLNNRFVFTSYSR